MEQGRFAALKTLRLQLHVAAEPSGGENITAEAIGRVLEAHSPTEVIIDLGGCGIAAVYGSERDGPTILFRADMDALPIPEKTNSKDGEKERPWSHRCGHDGHMTILAGVAMALEESRPQMGRVVLLFQPAEETGEGAARILDDSVFQQKIGSPDLVFALHNLPGFSAGEVVLRDGVFASSSRGMTVDFSGTTAHAAQPHLGRSPALAVSQLIQSLTAVPQLHTGLGEVAKVTVIHAAVGEPEAFGTSPGRGVVEATLRSHDDDVMAVLMERCSSMADGIGNTNDLATEIGWTQIFPSTVNHPEAVGIIEAAAVSLGIPVRRPVMPFPWSEDFGHFTGRFKGAMFGLGAGVDHPNLHNPGYEFPDELIPIGVSMFEEIARRTLRKGTDV